MISLHQLKNTHRYRKKSQRVGRGPGSHRGKTCCRGQKGEGARSGYKRRYGYEGGQMPLYRKLPCRGFTRGRFEKPLAVIHFFLINKLFQDGDIVSPKTLKEKGFPMHLFPGGLKVIDTGKLERKVSIEAHHFSKGASESLERSKIAYKKIER